jgi:hypothetical protein
MRTIHVDVTVHMVLKLADEEKVQELIDEMDYSFIPPEGMEGAIQDTEVTGHEVTDSR